MSYLPFGPVTSTTYANDRVLGRGYDLDYGIDHTLDAVGNVEAITKRGGLARADECKTVGATASAYTCAGSDHKLANVGGSGSRAYGCPGGPRGGPARAARFSRE